MQGYVHLVVKDLGLARGSVGDEAVVEDIEDVLADLLELGLDLVAVLLDGGDVFLGTLGLLLLLDGGDDAPRGTAGADDVFVSDAEEITLVDCELASNLGHLLHVGNHFIIALSLLAEAGQKSLAVLPWLWVSTGGLASGALRWRGARVDGQTFHAVREKTLAKSKGRVERKRGAIATADAKGTEKVTHKGHERRHRVRAGSSWLTAVGGWNERPDEAEEGEGCLPRWS